MKIQCQSCQAKYTIADEKVLGKVVKIRCKKCSATIVINGNEARAEDNADTHVFDYAAGQSNEQWTVNVADGDQRTMTAGEIVAEYKSGTINDETYCWKDGMADWLPLREIEQLYGAINLGPRPSLADDISVPPQSAPAAGLFAPPDGGESLFAGGGSAAPAAAHTNGNGALFGGVDPAPQPAAARRGGGRGQGADLFGNAATAGGEDDVMTSAGNSRGGGGGGGGGGGAGVAEEKLTGQRNENSVLFSLSALTDSAKAPENKTTATADGSGLIDIRALSASMGDENKKDKGSRVDDIMNLSGGGAFGAALAAPILAPPPIETVDPGTSASASSGNKTLLFGLLGAGAFVMIGIIVAVMMLKGGDDKKDAKGDSKASPTSSALAMNDTPSTANTGANAGSGSTPSGDSTGSTGGGDTASVPGSTGAAKPGTGAAKPSTGGGGGGTTAAKPKEPSGGGAAAPAVPPAEPAKPAQPASFGDALAAAAGKPKDAPAAAPAGGGGTAPFDRGAAAAALGGVNVQACKKPDGPTGSGHVKVTFAPDGSVSSAVVDGGPFPGTPVGGCIAGKYRGARVPAFGGAPVSVGKSFTLN